MEEKRKAAEAARYLSIGKDNENQHLIQEQAVFISLKEYPKTMKMVELETGIDRANICRYIHNFRKQNKVQVHHIGVCPISRYRRVGFLTTNNALFRAKSEQLNLFDLWQEGGLL